MKQLLAASFLPRIAMTFLMLTKPNNQTELKQKKEGCQKSLIAMFLKEGNKSTGPVVSLKSVLV